MSKTTRSTGTKATYPKPPQRRRPPRRGRVVLVTFLKLVFVGGIFASIAYGVVQYVIYSPRYLVSRVTVVGANLIPEQDIVNASGVTSGDNLMLLDTEAVAERVKKIPYVRVCNVRRASPDRVIIEINERHPGAMILINNHAYEIDDECVVLGPLNPLEPYAGPTISNLPDLTAVVIGQRIDSAALIQALEVWKAFSTVPLSQQVKLSELSAQSPDHISMFLVDVPFEIIWGRADYLMQARRLDTLWHNQNGQLPCKQSLSLQFDADLVCR